MGCALKKWPHSLFAQTGWLLPERNHPSAPLRWLREIFFGRGHPSLKRRGMPSIPVCSYHQDRCVYIAHAIWFRLSSCVQCDTHAGKVAPGGNAMTSGYKTAAAFAALMSLAVLSACTQQNAPSAAASSQSQRTKEQMIDLGRQHKTAFELYQTLREEAKGGQHLTATNIPDWTGVYTRGPVSSFSFDPSQPPDALPSAKLTPEFHAKMVKRVED